MIIESSNVSSPPNPLRKNMIPDKESALDSPPSYSDNGYGGSYQQLPLSYPSPNLPSRRPSGQPSLPHARLVQNGTSSKTPEYPRPSVDQVHILDRKHDVKGSFHIDPLVPSLDPSRRKKKGKGKLKEEPPHASFRTRNNAITLDLGTAGDVWKAPRANISVSNMSKDIKINLLPVSSSAPRIGLDVQSKHGNVILFVPNTFSGVIHMTTRRGGMDVLPALAARIKIVKQSEQETIFMIGARNGEEGENSQEASYCQLATRTGNVVVGLVGRDHYAPQAGFWKRLGSVLRGNSSSTDQSSES